MGRFEIEFAQLKDLAAIMDGEEIAEHDTHEYNIWNIRELI